ncbi:MAG: FHA domain-containing protein [Anaerolineales bacterium]|jgi:pSer/pThr/pTyr-binding forkhead associated (FHA) protein
MENQSSQLVSQLPDNVYLFIDKQLFRIKKTTVKIGRHVENDLIIYDPLVSRWHAEIRFEDASFIIYDNETKYGTKVNDESVSRCVLRSGDNISVANTPMLFIDRSEQILRRSEDTTRSRGKRKA